MWRGLSTATVIFGLSLPLVSCGSFGRWGAKESSLPFAGEKARPNFVTEPSICCCIYLVARLNIHLIAHTQVTTEIKTSHGHPRALTQQHKFVLLIYGIRRFPTWKNKSRVVSFCGGGLVVVFSPWGFRHSDRSIADWARTCLRSSRSALLLLLLLLPSSNFSSTPFVRQKDCFVWGKIFVIHQCTKILRGWGGRTDTYSVVVGKNKEAYVTIIRTLNVSLPNIIVESTKKNYYVVRLII